MAIKGERHIFKGMQRDLSISKYNPEFYFDALNIRITARDNNTLLSVTNERGTKEISILDSSGQALELKGVTLGYNVLNNYLTLFNKADKDYIYRLESKENNFEGVILFEGDLNFNIDNPIETLGVYETEDIQKVYWVDGINQPRVINIKAASDVISKWNKNSFDFVRKLNLQEEVTINKDLVSGGSFASGIIQYSFTYFNKYGQESNIFYTSPLYYISYNNRGASPEDSVGNSFTITISGVDTSFDYIRIYSIHRTSINSTPTCKIVADLSIPESGNINYTDNGTSGSTIDPTELLYVGGEEIVSGTMTQKDNTLFLGDIKNKRKVLSQNIRKFFREKPITFSSSIKSIVPPEPKGYYPYDNQLKMNSYQFKTFKYLEYYRLGIQAQHYTGKWSEPIWINDERNTVHIDTTFYDSGNIGLPIAEFILSDVSIIDELISQGYIKIRPVVVYPTINDREVICQGVLCPTVYNVSDRYGNSPFAQSSWFTRPNAPFDITKSRPSTAFYIFKVDANSGVTVGDSLIDFDTDVLYTVTEINSIEQIPPKEEIVTYCFYSPEGTNKPPKESGSLYVASSAKSINYDSWRLNVVSKGEWYPLGTSDIYPPNIVSRAGICSNNKVIVNYDDTDYTMELINKGAWAEFRHNYPIPSNNMRNAEIQCIWDPPMKPYVLNSASDSDINIWVSNNSENFYIDQSILTLHSPDIEFDDSLKNLDTTSLKLRIVGVVPLTSSATDIDIQTSTPVNNFFNSSDFPIGFYKEPIGCEHEFYSEGEYPFYIKTYGESHFGWRGLMSGCFWFDEITGYKNDKGNNDKLTTGFVVYPFHRNGSLNNTKFATNGYKSALLKTKRISNLKFSYKTQYIDNNYIWNAYVKNDDLKTGISGVSIFNTGDTGIIKIPAPKNSNLNDINYYGNVDKILSISRVGNKKDGYPIMTTGVQNASTNSHVLFSGDYIQVDATFTEQVTGIDPVRMKYNSTSHAILALNYGKNSEQRVLPTINDGDVVYPGVEYWAVNSVDGNLTSNNHLFWDRDKSTTKISQDIIDPHIREEINTIKGIQYGWLWLGELYNDNVQNRFGGQTEEAFENNQWVPCGDSISILDESGVRKDSVTIKWIEGDTYYQRYDHLKTYPSTIEDQNSITDIISFMCETRVNIDGRYDRNRGQINNIYMTPTNFNLINNVYTQKNNFFNYRPIDYSSFNLSYFPNTITWSKEKQAASDIDTWTNITMASVLDLDGDKGKVISLNTFNNEIYCFQERGLSNILFNSRVQIPSSDGVPIEITNGLKVNGKRYISNTIGCNNKWSIAESPSGLYFIDNETNSLYLFNGQLGSLSDKLGFRQWIGENNSHENWNPVDYKNFRTFYDKNNDDVYFINKSHCLCYSELLQQFTSFMSYENIPAMFNISSDLYSIKDNKIWKNFEGDYNMFYGEFKPYYITLLSNSEEPYDKIFNTIEFRADSWNNDELLNNKTFDTLEVWNEYQRGESNLENIIGYPSPLKKKFRVWRANIPRDKSNNRDRIRNTWAYIKLSMNKENTWRTELHDVNVYYFI